MITNEEWGNIYKQLSALYYQLEMRDTDTWKFQVLLQNHPPNIMIIVTPNKELTGPGIGLSNKHMVEISECIAEAAEKLDRSDIRVSRDRLLEYVVDKHDYTMAFHIKPDNYEKWARINI